MLNGANDAESLHTLTDYVHLGFMLQVYITEQHNAIPSSRFSSEDRGFGA